jgi:hypothetical protein
MLILCSVLEVFRFFDHLKELIWERRLMVSMIDLLPTRKKMPPCSVLFLDFLQMDQDYLCIG